MPAGMDFTASPSTNGKSGGGTQSPSPPITSQPANHRVGSHDALPSSQELPQKSPIHSIKTPVHTGGSQGWGTGSPICDEDQILIS